MLRCTSKTHRFLTKHTPDDAPPICRAKKRDAPLFLILDTRKIATADSCAPSAGEHEPTPNDSTQTSPISPLLAVAPFYKRAVRCGKAD